MAMTSWIEANAIKLLKNDNKGADLGLEEGTRSERNQF